MLWLVGVFDGIFTVVADETPLWKTIILGLGALSVFLFFNAGIIGFLFLVVWDIGMPIYLKVNGLGV